MAARAVVVVTVEYVDAETGLWCNACALPSGARLWFTTTPRTAGARTTLQSTHACLDCGSRDITGT